MMHFFYRKVMLVLGLVIFAGLSHQSSARCLIQNTEIAIYQKGNQIWQEKQHTTTVYRCPTCKQIYFDFRMSCTNPMANSKQNQHSKASPSKKAKHPIEPKNTDTERTSSLWIWGSFILLLFLIPPIIYICYIKKMNRNKHRKSSPGKNRPHTEVEREFDFPLPKPPDKMPIYRDLSAFQQKPADETASQLLQPNETGIPGTPPEDISEGQDSETNLAAGEPIEENRTWDKFKSEPLLPELQNPYPLFVNVCNMESDLESDIALNPTQEEIEEWQEKYCWAQLAKDCENPEQQMKIAQQFIQWAEEQKDGSSLLMQGGKPEHHYWFIGDIHGYLGALLKCFAFVSEYHARKGGAHTVIMLGDVLDRGPQCFTTLAMLQHCLLHSQEVSFRLICLKGNHDVGLRQLEDGRFISAVKPSESAEYLNALAESQAELAAALGKAAMEWARISSCMGEITNLGGNYENNSILFTHGGLPHVDIQKKLYESYVEDAQPLGVDFMSSIPEELHQECSKDFIWVRLVDDLPWKLPNRGNSGCQMGTEDVNTYRRVHHLLTGRSVSFVVRGHDHEKEGFRLYSVDETKDPSTQRRKQKNCGILTINAMEPSTAEGGFSISRKPTLLHWSLAQSMMLYTMPAAPLPEGIEGN